MDSRQKQNSVSGCACERACHAGLPRTGPGGRFVAPGQLLLATPVAALIFTDSPQRRREGSCFEWGRLSWAVCRSGLRPRVMLHFWEPVMEKVT
jgi:hypothetical protein